MVFSVRIFAILKVISVKDKMYFALQLGNLFVIVGIGLFKPNCTV